MANTSMKIISILLIAFVIYCQGNENSAEEYDDFDDLPEARNLRTIEAHLSKTTRSGQTIHNYCNKNNPIDKQAYTDCLDFHLRALDQALQEEYDMYMEEGKKELDALKLQREKEEREEIAAKKKKKGK